MERVSIMIILSNLNCSFHSKRLQHSSIQLSQADVDVFNGAESHQTSHYSLLMYELHKRHLNSIKFRRIAIQTFVSYCHSRCRGNYITEGILNLIYFKHA